MKKFIDLINFGPSVVDLDLWYSVFHINGSRVVEFKSKNFWDAVRYCVDNGIDASVTQLTRKNNRGYVQA